MAIAMPERKFLAVEAWGPADSALKDLPNVRILPKQWSLSSYYDAARLLLVPSVVDDAFPRVVTEAALHGVPCLGSDRGGTPEAVGAGGEVLPLCPALWVDAVRRMDDDVVITKFSRIAQGQAYRRTHTLLPTLEREGVI
jgi:glycosyltransferase involved in cell wall biosynthesis